MEEQKEVMELLKQINASSRRQARYIKIQCFLALVTAVCFIGIAVLVYDLMPQLNEVIVQLPGMVEQMDTVLGNLEVVTEELAAVDFQTMVQDVSTLVSTGQESLKEVVEKLNTIDFTALNNAIGDLSDVIEPLARFFNAFNR